MPFPFFLSLSCLLTLCSCRIPRENIADVMDRRDLRTLTLAPEETAKAGKNQFKPTGRPRKKPFVPAIFHRKISLSLTDTMPLKESLFHLAKQGGINIHIDPKIDTTLYFSAENRPMIEVIRDICSLSNLRYRIRQNNLIIEKDLPYTHTYNIQFLNVSRQTENRASIGTDVFSESKAHPGSSDNGSNSSVTTKTTADFWGELDANMKTILSGDIAETGRSSYSIHRQGGLISVRATGRQQDRVRHYLDQLRVSTSTQVLIETKVIEVTLKDQYKSGINWQKLTGGDLRGDLPFGQFAQRAPHATPSFPASLLSFGAQSQTFTTIVKAIEEFGATRTLSSPRLTVLNNQTAFMKVCKNQVYFRLHYDKQYNLAVNRENVMISSDVHTVPVGFVMSVQPSIDPETGDILLALRPTLSRLTQTVSDPAVDVALSQQRGKDDTTPYTPSLIPVMEVREIDSVIRLGKGIAVMGGFMEVRNTNGTHKLPGVGDLPIVGNLFQGTVDTEEVVELVILLRATIVPNESAADAADERLQDYIDDPRPFL